MTEDFNELVKEAGELGNYFSTTWWRLSHRCSLLHPRWKRKVLEYVRCSLGERSRFYLTLAEVEKEYSDRMPGKVLLHFLRTLKEIRYLSENSLLPPRVPEEPVVAVPPSPCAPAEPVVLLLEWEARPEPPAALFQTPEPRVTPEAVAPSGPELKIRSTDGNAEFPRKPFVQLELEAEEIYRGLLAAAREYMIYPDRPRGGAYEEIAAVCDPSLETLKTNTVLLNYISFSSAENYLYAHTANVVVLSQAIALDLKLSQDEIRLLSFCAMAHDWGMTEYRELSSKKEYLTDAEYSRVALHVEAGVARLDNLADMDPRLKERSGKIVRQVHERVNAGGYPFRLRGKEIDLLAQILGAADVYEAMTHPRSWREAFSPAEVVKQFIERRGGQEFNPQILKAIIHVLSIYPPASLVALSSGEIARVIKLRKGSLTRPQVEILLDADFVPVQGPVLDLYEDPLRAGIVRPVSLAELKRIHPESAAGLEAARWWEGNREAEPRSVPACSREAVS